MRLPMEGQELVADVHGTHVHEADPWGTAAIGVHDSGVQPREEGCEGRRRRPVAFRVGRGEQRWEGLTGSTAEVLPWKMSWAYTSGTRCLVAKNTVMLRRVSMTTCCSPLASHPRSSRGNILQHVSSMLMMRLRSVMPASFNVHSIFCWHSSRSVRVVASGHSFPSSPLGFLEGVPK